MAEQITPAERVESEITGKENTPAEDIQEELPGIRLNFDPDKVKDFAQLSAAEQAELIQNVKASFGENAKRIIDRYTEIAQTSLSAIKAISETAMPNEQITDMLAQIVEQNKKAFAAIESSNAYKHLHDTMLKTQEIADGLNRRFKEGDTTIFTAFADFDPDITPFLKEEIYKLQEELPAEELEALTLFNFVEERHNPDTGEIIPSYFEIALERAQKALANSRKSPLKRAAEAGAITTVGGRQMLITDTDFSGAFSFFRNKNAYLAMLNTGFMDSLTFVDGKLNLLHSGNISTGQIKKWTRKGLEPAKEFDLPLFVELVTAVSKSNPTISPDMTTATVYLPTFCREMGIDITGGHAQPLFEKLTAFESCLGVMDNGSFYRVFSLTSYNKDENTLTFTMPYLFYLFRAIDDKNRITAKDGHTWQLPSRSYLVHSDIASERDKAAVEIVYYLVRGLQQRGGKADSKLSQNKDKAMNNPALVSYSTSYQAVINSCPRFKYELDSTAATKNKNNVLQRHFNNAAKLLKTRTDLFKYYCDLSITMLPPTMSRLKEKIIITHTGINGDYKLPEN